MLAALARKLCLAILAAASVWAVEPAWAGCGCPCGVRPPVVGPCGGFWPEPYVAAAPVQPTFYVDQGPTYRAVLVAPEDAERWLVFAHPHLYPYIHSSYGPDHWWTTQIRADGLSMVPHRRYPPHHHRDQ